ncbi:MAG: hypothetical protein GYA23_07395 [Methanomicrobiales archaeon]|nr:hypothetical protein [Methanomicrobiales archaeon]
MDEFPPPLRVLQLILAGFCLFFVFLAVFIVIFSNSALMTPHVVIDPAAPPLPPVNVTRSFIWHNTSYTIPLSVNGTVYAATKKTFRTIFMVGNVSDLEDRYFGAIRNDPSQEDIYEDLLSSFRRIRSEQHLSDDEYLELMAAYVQTIPYRDGGTQPPKYPSELLVDNMGDCDDKAILLSGLLSREGYTVVLFRFGPESHMAMGIGSDAFPYKATGYTYLEAMTPAYAGVPSFTLVTKKPLKSDPVVIPVSTGPRLYRSGNQTSLIRNMTDESETRVRDLSARLDAYPAESRAGPEYLALLAERDRYTRIHEYLRNNPLDRPGAFAYLQHEMNGSLSLPPGP